MCVPRVCAGRNPMDVFTISNTVCFVNWCACVYARIYIYIYISSSSSCRAGSTDIPDPLSPLLPYRSSPQTGLLDNIPYPHIVAECMFELVVLLLYGHVWGSTRVHHL